MEQHSFSLQQKATPIAAGIYLEKAKRLYGKFPDLKYQDDSRRRKGVGSPTPLAVTILELDHSPVKRRDFFDKSQLEAYLNDTSCSRRVILADCDSPEANAVLGNALNISPLIFYEQVLQTINDIDPLISTMPSDRNARPSSLWFPEVCEIPQSKAGDIGLETRGDLHVFETVGEVGWTECCIMRRATFLVKRIGVTGWEALFLLPPSVFEEARPLLAQDKIPVKSWGAEYRDFIPAADLDDALATPGPPRTSMREDLCHYWQQHAHLLPNQGDPVVASAFFKKLVALRWATALSMCRSRLDQSVDVHTLLDRSAHIDSDQVTRHWLTTTYNGRVVHSLIRYLHYTYDALGPFAETDDVVIPDWLNTDRDYPWLLSCYEEVFRHLDSGQQVSPALLNLLASQRSLEESHYSLMEAKAVKSLTWIATLFIPLTFVSGIFSMGDEYRPGAARFWVYFAVAVPLTIIAVGVVSFVSLRYRLKSMRDVPKHERSMRI